VTSVLRVNADGSTGEPAPEPEPEPEPIPEPGPVKEITVSDSPAFNVTSARTIENLLLRTTISSGQAFDFKAQDTQVNNVTLAGSNWGDALRVNDGCKRLRIVGFGGESHIIRHWFYDNSFGDAEDVYIDLGGQTWHGSRDENCVRVKAIKRFTLRNGTILSPKIGTIAKAWITVQAEPRGDGPEDVLIENIRCSGPWGVGPIKTASGWQHDTVRRVTFRDIESDNAGDLTIQAGARDVLLERVGRPDKPFIVPTRTPIRFEGGNPHFPNDRPNVHLRDCHFKGGSSRFVNDTSLGDVTYVDSTWNGRAL
jgi:hypothetical protein